MLTKNLFNDILLEPAKKGGNKLYIVSGYATAAMVFHHLDLLKNFNKTSIELIVGMCSLDGLSESNHRGFQQISNDYSKQFKCSYVIKPPAVHSKIYAWFRGDKPLYAYAGSANYTQTAFFNKQREVVTECSPEECLEYFESIIDDTIYCTHNDAENFVQIYKDQQYARLRREKIIEAGEETDETVLIGLPHEKISFLDRSGKLPARSGLNWGQRPEEKREANQAYIKLPSSVYRTSFFPPVGEHFTVHTDDNKVLICTRAQQNGKAIHTPHNNSLIGLYFRNRLGLSSGAFVKKSDLLAYGRTDIDFYKIDDENYYMDFSI